MDEHWRDTVEVRGIETWDSIAYPPNAPLTTRPDWRKAGADTDPAKAAQGDARPLRLRPRHLQFACSPSSSSATRTWPPPSPARSTTGWRPNGSPRTSACAARPCCRSSRRSARSRRSSGCAGDKRFVQVLMLAMGEHPLGKSMYWPIYAAAERHGFTVGIHAGSQLPPPADGLGLAHLLPRGLRRPVAGLPHPARQPHLRGRVRQIPQAEGGADRIRHHLAAALPVAALQVLARRAQRGALDRPLARGVRARSRPADDPTL